MRGTAWSLAAPVILRREDAEGPVPRERDGSFAVFAAQDDRRACDTSIAARINAPPIAKARVNGSPYQTIDVTDAATGSNARITAASVALTRACPHISATNAIAVVTIAVTRMTIATSRVIGARGAKNDAGIAKSPTAST